jgi:hypothetical protein
MGFSGLSRGSTALLIGITPPGSKAILDTSLFIGSRKTRAAGSGLVVPLGQFVYSICLSQLTVP